MSFLPSFKSTFSSLADATQRKPTPHAEDSSRAATSGTAAAASIYDATTTSRAAPPSPKRPSIPPLPLELLPDVAPAFGFDTRPRIKSRRNIPPLPLEMLSDDAAPFVALECRRSPAASVHAGAYKRPRSTPRASVSGGSYVRASCERRTSHSAAQHDSTERATMHGRSTTTLTCMPTYASAARRREPERPAPTVTSASPRCTPSGRTSRCAQLVTFVTPSLSHRSAGSRMLPAHVALLQDDGDIVDESAYRTVDVLSSPMKRSLYSGGTPRLRTGNALTLSRGPTESDMSHFLRRERAEGFVDGTDRVALGEEERRETGSERSGGKEEVVVVMQGNEPWRQQPRPKREESDRVVEDRDAECVQCPHCPKKLLNQVTLQNHVRVVHDHSGSFECPQCGLKFMWRSTLRNHVRLVHEKQRPYACEDCGKAFRWKSHLREHFSVVHKGEKPFKCAKCGKAFGRKNNMQKHMRKHADGNL